MITFGQKPETIFEKIALPAAADDLPSMIHIIFVHQKATPNELPTLQSSKKVISVNRNKIYQWLKFLKHHNPFYWSVTIDEDALGTYSDTDCIPSSLQQSVSIVQDTDSADVVAETGVVPGPSGVSVIDSADQFQQSLVFEDTLHYKELYGTIKDQLNSSIPRKRKWDADQTLAMISSNQTFSSRLPSYYACLFPVLFLLGIGTPLDNRPTSLSLKLFVKRSLFDTSSPFRTNALWLFLTFDQLRQIELFSTLKIRLQKMSHTTLNHIKDLTLVDLQKAVRLKESGQSLPEGHAAKPLMDAVRISGAALQYTQQFRSTARDEIRATILKHRLSTLPFLLPITSTSSLLQCPIKHSTWIPHPFPQRYLIQTLGANLLQSIPSKTVNSFMSSSRKSLALYLASKTRA